MNDRAEQDLPLAQPLTPREEEILALIGDEMTNRQIAEELTIALSTVKWYVRQIYNKLGVGNRAAAVDRAQSLGLLVSGEQDRPVRNNLPLAATPFVGRVEELEALAGLIADPQVRIITIVGPGGIGKTRLALQAAGREVSPQSLFPDGVFFVSLALLESTEEIVSALAATLDFQFQESKPSSKSDTDQILDYLCQKQMLLLMDNFEHILEGQMLLAEISRRAPGIKLTVTSRERLQMRGEQLFPVQGLETPQNENVANEALAAYAAAQLFLNIARRTVPDFQLLEGDTQQLIRICRLVEGMPLGLELAASWVGLLPLSEIAAEIEQSLYLLTAEHSDVPQRHHSMKATLDVSWRRLNSEQQSTFQELSIFRGGFTRTAAVEVASATLPLLVTLVNKSWLSYDRQIDRYQIHELLRQYGAAKLNANPARRQEVQNQHSAYFCGFLQERETDWIGARQKEAASELRDDIDNIQRTWRRAADTGNGALLAQGLDSLCRFYVWESRLKNGRNVCRLARNGLLNHCLEQQADDMKHLALRSQILAWESGFVNRGADKEALLAQSQDLLDRAAQSGQDTRPEQAFVLLKKGQATQYADYLEAKKLTDRGLVLFQDLGNRWGEAEALELLGSNSLFMGNYDQANDLLRESLAIRQRSTDTNGTAGTMLKLGLVARHQGNFKEAETLHRQSLELIQQIGNRQREMTCLSVLSYTLSFAGSFIAARETADRMLDMGRDLGQYPNPWHLNPLAMAIIHLGHYTETKAVATETLKITRKRGLLMDLSWALMYLGDVALAEGDLAAAERYLLESISTLTELKHIYQSLVWSILGYVVRAQGDGNLACDYLLNALRSGTAHRSITPTLYCLPLAALLSADNGNRRKAIELYSLAQQFAHIRNSRWFEDIAGRELSGVCAALPPEVAAAAEASGRELDVWRTTETLLRELDCR